MTTQSEDTNILQLEDEPPEITIKNLQRIIDEKELALRVHESTAEALIEYLSLAYEDLSNAELRLKMDNASYLIRTYESKDDDFRDGLKASVHRFMWAVYSHEKDRRVGFLQG